VRDKKNIRKLRKP